MNDDFLDILYIIATLTIIGLFWVLVAGCSNEHTFHTTYRYADVIKICQYDADGEVLDITHHSTAQPIPEGYLECEVENDNTETENNCAGKSNRKGKKHDTRSNNVGNTKYKGDCTTGYYQGLESVDIPKNIVGGY